MLFTRESDYAIRVVRALKDGEKKSIRQICAIEEIPEAFCYKIVKKLQRAGVVEIIRGTGGGCRLKKQLSELTLYDAVTAIEPGFAVMDCVHHFCSRNTDEEKCKVHKELLSIQHAVEELLREKTFCDILSD